MTEEASGGQDADVNMARKGQADEISNGNEDPIGK